MLLGMDWLYLHRTKVDYYDKFIKCVDGNGEPSVLQGKKKTTSIRMVTVMQEKCSCKKGCMLFAVQILWGCRCVEQVPSFAIVSGCIPLGHYIFSTS